MPHFLSQHPDAIRGHERCAAACTSLPSSTASFCASPDVVCALHSEAASSILSFGLLTCSFRGLPHFWSHVLPPASPSHHPSCHFFLECTSRRQWLLRASHSTRRLTAPPLSIVGNRAPRGGGGALPPTTPYLCSFYPLTV